MKLIERVFEVNSRADGIKIYPLGDVHIGCTSCAESKFKKMVAKIAKEPNSYWFGGGDMIDGIKLQDVKRSDPNTFPDWLLSGTADNIRENIVNMSSAEASRFVEFTKPIAGKCLGLICGNHEHSLRKYHGQDVVAEIVGGLRAEELGRPQRFGEKYKGYIEDLTDEFFMRLKFVRKNKRGKTLSSSSVKMYACHGFGGGRTAGAEPTHLERLAKGRDVDIVLRGHSHTFHILPAIVSLTIPNSGKLDGVECIHKEKRCGNWGCWVKSNTVGQPTYASMANYPARSLTTLSVSIRPFAEREKRLYPKIMLQEVSL